MAASLAGTTTRHWHQEETMKTYGVRAYITTMDGFRSMLIGALAIVYGLAPKK